MGYFGNEKWKGFHQSCHDSSFFTKEILFYTVNDMFYLHYVLSKAKICIRVFLLPHITFVCYLNRASLGNLQPDWIFNCFPGFSVNQTGNMSLQVMVYCSRH